MADLLLKYNIRIYIYMYINKYQTFLLALTLLPTGQFPPMITCSLMIFVQNTSIMQTKSMKFICQYYISIVFRICTFLRMHGTAFIFTTEPFALRIISSSWKWFEHNFAVKTFSSIHKTTVTLLEFSHFLETYLQCNKYVIHVTSHKF